MSKRMMRSLVVMLSSALLALPSPGSADTPPNRRLTYAYEGTWLPLALPEPGRPPVLSIKVTRATTTRFAPRHPYPGKDGTRYLMTLVYRCGANVCTAEKIPNSVANDVNLGFHFRMAAPGAPLTAPRCLISVRLDTQPDSATGGLRPNQLRLTVHPFAEDRVCTERIEPGFLVLSIGEVRREGARP